MAYPRTREGQDLDGRAGLNVADPYRWLEAPTPDVTEWQRVQTTLARNHVESLPHFEDFAKHVQDLYAGRPPSVPRYAGGRWFRVESPLGSTFQDVVVSDEPLGQGQVLTTSRSLAPDNPAAYISWLSPSPDGSVLAVGVCRDGSENNSIVLLDRATGQHLPDLLPQVLFDAWGGGAVWLPDSSGFFFIAVEEPAEGHWQALYFHRLGAPAPDRPEPGVFAEGAARDYLFVSVSRDGSWAVLSRRLAAPTPFAVRDLRDPAARWRPFVTRTDCAITGHVIDDCYVAVTDLDAPRGRLVAIPLDASDPDDDTHWRELVSERSAVLRTVTPVGSVLYLTEMVDTYSAVRIVDLDGRHLDQVDLPANGAVAEPHFPLMTMVPRGHPAEFVFAFSTLTSSWGIYRHRHGRGGIEELRPPDVVLTGATVEDRWARSCDGTPIPYHVVWPAGVSEGPLPALIWGYGGFNIANVPQFPGAMAAVVAAGGLFVHAHLRGGAEFGKEWWEGGRGIHKQKTFDDLYAIAEDLIAQGITTSAQLGLTGGSNGGLLCGVAATQRPELFGAVVPQVPILDLVGALRNPYGEATVREYADPDDIDELRRLLTISPYHLVQQGTDYPAIFVVAGDTDPRCPPWHARKWVARMQEAQQSDSPVLLRVWDSVGHGLATPPDIVRRQATEWLTFLAAQIGLA